MEKDGYWIRSSVKIELTPEEKKKIGRPTSPRWEIDLVAYKAKSNELLVVECKSFLDSSGVRASGFNGKGTSDEKRYKLFNDPVLRKTVLGRLVKQFVASGSCSPSPFVKLCLAAGKVSSESDRDNIKKRFECEGWEFFDNSWLRERLSAVSKSGYENDVASVVAKILLRENQGIVKISS